MLCRDVMTRNVVTAGPDMPVVEIARVLVDRNISAVPVVDDDRVVGVVSEGDLIRHIEPEPDRRSWWLTLIQCPDERALKYLRSHGQLARHVMTSPAITVTENTPLSDAARILEERRIKRVPVVQDGRLVGIVSRANILQGLVSADFHAPVAHTDSELRQAVLDILKNKIGVGQDEINVTVVSGVAHLWGLAESTPIRQAVEAATGNVEGVISVENHVFVLTSNIRSQIDGI